MKTSLKVVDAALSPRSNRDALASAISAQRRLEAEFQKNQEAIERAQERIGQLEGALAAARADVDAAKIGHAEAVTQSFVQAEPFKKNTALRDARAREAELLDDLEAARTALSNFERVLADDTKVEYYSDDELYERRGDYLRLYGQQPPEISEQDRIKDSTVTLGTRNALAKATEQTAHEADDVIRREADLDGLMAMVTDLTRRLSAPCAILCALLRDGLVPAERAKAVAQHMEQVGTIPFVVQAGSYNWEYDPGQHRFNSSTTTWSKGVDNLRSYTELKPWNDIRLKLRSDPNAELPNV